MHFKSKLLGVGKVFSTETLFKLYIMITLFGCAHFFNFVSFLLYPTEVKRLSAQR